MSKNSETSTISDIEKCLNEELSKIPPDEIQRMYNQNGRDIKRISGRFDCENCGRWWHSAFNTINVKWIYDPANQKIKISDLKKYGKQCQGCDVKVFYKPNLDAESAADKILKHLKNQWSYNTKPQNFGGPPHDSERCEACHLGICKIGGNTQIDDVSDDHENMPDRDSDDFPEDEVLFSRKKNTSKSFF